MSQHQQVLLQSTVGVDPWKCYSCGVSAEALQSVLAEFRTGACINDCYCCINCYSSLILPILNSAHYRVHLLQPFSCADCKGRGALSAPITSPSRPAPSPAALCLPAALKRSSTVSRSALSRSPSSSAGGSSTAAYPQTGRSPPTRY